MNGHVVFSAAFQFSFTRELLFLTEPNLHMIPVPWQRARSGPLISLQQRHVLFAMMTLLFLGLTCSWLLVAPSPTASTATVEPNKVRQTQARPEAPAQEAAEEEGTEEEGEEENPTIISVVEQRPPRGEAPQACVDTSRLPRIHLPLSVTSRNLKAVRDLTALPLFQYALPTFITSVEPALFRYGVSLGADAGDPWYDHAEHQAEMLSWWTRRWHQHWDQSSRIRFCDPDAAVPPFEILIYNNTQSRNVWAVNYATQRAYEAGYDYFYRINDDTVLYPNQWSSRFVAKLNASRPLPFVGVTGPRDTWRAKEDPLLTHSFVARPHLAIFGAHFNYYFGNYFSDDWIHWVYHPPYNETIFGANASMFSILEDVTVTHKVVKSRYEVKANRDQYKRILQLDREALEAYVWRQFHPPEPPAPPSPRTRGPRLKPPPAKVSGTGTAAASAATTTTTKARLDLVAAILERRKQQAQKMKLGAS